MEKVLFKEEQRFNQWWLWALIIVSFWLPLLFLIRPLLSAWKEGSKDFLLLLFVMLFILTFVLVFVWLFKKLKLVVEIKTDGIWFKYPPLLYKWKTIKKEDIQKFEVRKYRPISEYGGWGTRTKWKSRSIAYNVSGNIGLQLYLKSGRKILLGTQKKQAIEHAMRKLMETKNEV